jgi:hypothetical protein
MAHRLETLVVIGAMVTGAWLLPSAATVSAQPSPRPKDKPSAPIAVAEPSCKLENTESPRGGRLDVTGSGFGQAPVVRIAGKVARLLERQPEHLSVQVARDSDGGEVTVQAGGKTVSCGTLTIIGKDR